MEMVTIHCSTRYKNIGVRQAVDLAVFCRSSSAARLRLLRVSFRVQLLIILPGKWPLTSCRLFCHLRRSEARKTKHKIKGEKNLAAGYFISLEALVSHEGVDGLGPHDVLGQAVPVTDASGQEGLMVVLSPALKLRVLLVCGRACSDYGAGWLR